MLPTIPVRRGTHKIDALPVDLVDCTSAVDVGVGSCESRADGLMLVG